MFNRAQQKFAELHVTLYDASGSGIGLVTSDNPILLSRGEGLIDVDNRDRLIAVGDSQSIYFPLRQTLGVCLTSKQEKHARLPGAVRRRINNAMWRAAHGGLPHTPPKTGPKLVGE